MPDLGFHRRGVDLQLYMPTAALVVEVLSPDDETFAKFGFYAARGVQELWVVDPLEHTVRCWQLRNGGYKPAEASALLGLRMDALAAELDWP